MSYIKYSYSILSLSALLFSIVNCIFFCSSLPYEFVYNENSTIKSNNVAGYVIQGCGSAVSEWLSDKLLLVAAMSVALLALQVS